jgi:redox-sensitive bicupin YhaK (pirin superfamily)
MEIITYVIEGTLEHQDSMGHKETIGAGEVQRMSAGTGVRHSEYNPSQNQGLHLLQIWILPKKEGIRPSYEQKNFAQKLNETGWVLAVSENAEEGSIGINQNAKLYLAKLKPGATKELSVLPKRHLWVQLIRGEISVDGIQMRAGDGLAVSEEEKVRIESLRESEFLVFDLA